MIFRIRKLHFNSFIYVKEINKKKNLKLIKTEGDKPNLIYIYKRKLII